MARSRRSARRLAQTPTLYTGRVRRWLASPGAHPSDSGLRHLPAFWEGAWRTIWSPPWPPGDRAARAVYDSFVRRQREVVRQLFEAGVELHAGTDTLMPYVAPGSSLHGELREPLESPAYGLLAGS
jgi:hypothetical protein